MEDEAATAKEEVEVAEASGEARALPTGEPRASEPPSLDLVIDLPVKVSVEIGRTQVIMRDVLELGTGSVIELDRGSNDPADLLVNGRLIARGDLTSIDDKLAIRIVELVHSGRRGGEGA
jgi:flagellar motor switch protein FliN/FliY